MGYQGPQQGGRDRTNEILTMEDILKMLRAGLSENTIIEKVRSSDVVDLSTDDIIEWKNKGISESIIEECLKLGRTTKKRQPRSDLGTTGLIRNNVAIYFLYIVTIGIYYLFWIHRVSSELLRHDPEGDNISPGRAVGFCFIPFFNVYWLGMIYDHTCNRANELYYRLSGRSHVVSPGNVITVYIVLMIISIPINFVAGVPIGLLLGSLLMQIPLIMTQAGLNRYWQQYQRKEKERLHSELSGLKGRRLS